MHYRCEGVAAVISAAISLAACGGTAPRLVVPGVDGDYAARVPDAAMWQALAAHAGNEVMSRVEVVKVVLDHEGEHLYFLQSRRWPIHYDFARNFLSTPGMPVASHGRFNDHEYHDADRRFVLGAITHFLDQDVWTFELFAGDKLTVPETAKLFGQVRDAAFFGDKLRYRPVPEAHVLAIDQVRTLMPTITTDELFANVRYMPLEVGDAFGTLRIVPAGQAPPPDLHPYDVVVLGTQPLELGPVAAIITDELQAPLGHLAVLAHTRGTPNMTLRKASEDPALLALAGKPVHLRVGSNDYAITPATPEDLQRVAKARAAKAPPLVLDPRDPGLLALAAIEPDDTARFGAKTTQLARVARLTGIVTPRAFGLSFHAYLAFLAANHFDREIGALLADRTLRKDDAQLRARLAALRDAIEHAPVPAVIVDPLLARIHAVLPGAARVRLRSSTNAEDLAGFSGAGLYHSARVDPQSRDDVERGLREVWASVWSYEAFVERDYWAIDHKKVAMAILVQESIDDDDVNGVAITGNPFYEGRPAVYINAQARGGSVTGAAGGEVPEQILVYTYERPRGVERISNSSRARSPLLSQAEAIAFANQLETIHAEFVDEAVGSARAVDVEFLIRKNRQIVIVQARPYEMKWREDRLRGD